jgi:tRNA threonylcarbamoyladenosine biosynthesis protein TsaB
VLAQERSTTRFGQAERLFASVDAVMRRASLSPSTISLIGVTVGPGSFTGIRVALSAARGIALAIRAPLIGVTSFEAVAAQLTPLACEDDCHLLIALESRREDLYVQLFNRVGISLFAPEAVTPGLLGAALGQSIGAARVLVAGDAATRAVNAIARRRRATAIEASAPDAAGVLRAVLRRWRAGERAGRAVPLYLRPPDVTVPHAHQGVTA